MQHMNSSLALHKEKCSTRALSGQMMAMYYLLLQLYCAHVEIPDFIIVPLLYIRKFPCFQELCTGPGWCSSVDQVLACEPKHCQFNSQSGHMPGLG